TLARPYRCIGTLPARCHDFHSARSTSANDRSGTADGLAVAVIGYGQEFSLLWVAALTDSSAIWCAPNAKVRMQASWSMGRKAPVSSGDLPKNIAALSA